MFLVIKFLLDTVNPFVIFLCHISYTGNDFSTYARFQFLRTPAVYVLFFCFLLVKIFTCQCFCLQVKKILYYYIQNVQGLNTGRTRKRGMSKDSSPLWHYTFLRQNLVLSILSTKQFASHLQTISPYKHNANDRRNYKK